MPHIDTIQRAQLDRLRTQFAGLERILGRFDEPGLHRAPAYGKWSAREHIAHLARYHRVFLERLSRILHEERPLLDRYRAETDPQWPEWHSLPVDAALAQLRSSHAEVTRQLERLSSDQFSRMATHPVFGALTLGDWLEFFLIHEAHHVYAIFMLSGER